MARRTTQAAWEERLDRWRKSGQSLDDFAVREGVKPVALKWWKWKLGGKQRGGHSPRASFVEVRESASVPPPAVAPVAGVATPLTRYEVVLGNGRVVRVPEQFTEDALARVLAAAERAR